MGLTNIKRKLFSKRSSRTANRSPVAEVQATRNQEAAIAGDQSHIHFRPQTSLVSQTLLSELSNQDKQPAVLDSSRPALLLLGVLPIIKELIARCEEHSNDRAVQNGASYSRTKKFTYLGRASLAISLLEKHLARTQESGQVGEFDDTLNQLAHCLEVMLGNSDTAMSHRVLRDLWKHSQTSTKDNALLKEAQKSLNSRGNEEWRSFSQSLAVFTDQLQCVGDDVKDEKLEQDRATILRRPLPAVGEFIGHAFSVMNCTCSLHSVRQLSLRLCTYRESNETMLPSNVTILSKKLGDSPKQWAEIQVRGSHDIRFEGQEGSAKLVITNSPSEDMSSLTRSLSFPLKEIACICDCYQPEFPDHFWRINVQLYNSRISKCWADKRVLSSTSVQNQVSLKQLISPDGSTMSGIAKMTLSVFLAYSIFYLYGGSWARGGWKRENIVFFADGNGIPMRPFLKVTPPPSDRGKPCDDGLSFHRYPEFLELGIMLLEIHFGQSLETMLGRDKEIESADEYFAAASEAYDKKKLDIISRGLRYAVESCLKPDFDIDLGIEDPDDDELRNKVFETVVQPLEEELERAFQEFISIDSLDDEASTKIRLPFKSSTLGPLLQENSSQDEQKPRQRSPMTHTKSNSYASMPQLTRGAWKPKSCSPSISPQSFELFSNESKTIESRPDMNSATDDWIERFMQLVNQFHANEDDAPAHLQTQNSTRLKVAILDTGLDINHPEIDGERIKERKSWTGTSADEDASGHGTHIASTILSLTRNVDVYIAKVTENNTLEMTDHVADAINFASQEWKVDMISLSLGFQRGIPSIQRAIDKAASPEHNIIILAAASNDASNTPRAYPASHDRVICIHSADGLGNRSKFNPTAVEGTDNFCFIGEDIEAAWPSGQVQHQGVRRMSGTSFATPVGVAVAAFMLEFVGKNIPEHAQWLTPLRSYRGVRAIFHALSQRRDGGYHLVNPLYSFLQGGSRVTQVLSAIENELNR